MRADRDVGIEFPNLLQELCGASPLHLPLEAIVMERLIGGVVEPSEDSRGSGNQVEIAVAIHLAERRRHEGQYVEICDGDTGNVAAQR
jgi:hypothetical protein